MHDRTVPKLSQTTEARAAREYWLLTLRYGEHITRAEATWCNEPLKQFDGEMT
jgi:hypothetical protein